VVRRGEYLKVIAAKYRVSWRTIAQINNLRNPNVIYPGQRLKIPIPCPKPPAPKPPKPKPQPPSEGPWHGQYWNNRDLAGSPKYTRNVQALNFNWGKGSPANLSNDNFSVRWTRTRYFDAGRYLFDVQVDDGVRVLLDGKLIIDQWHDTAPRHYTVERELGAGNHQLQVDYYEHTGGAQIKLTIEDLGRPPTPGAWQAHYFNNIKLEGPAVWTPTHSEIDFDWGKGSPRAGISADFFSARWTGKFHFSAAKYRFYATVDDGIRIYLDDTLILDEWHVTSRHTYSVDVDVGEGDHDVKVEYFERNGSAVAKVWWIRQ
jgi:LysM repeat protein